MSKNGKGTQKTYATRSGDGQHPGGYVVEVYFLLQQPVRAELEVNDLTCSNHSPDSIINISYASVQGKVRNMDIQAVDNVTLIIEIWCPVQNTNNMDLPLADRMILIQKETFNVGSIEGSSFKEFQFNIPYSASPNYDTINLSARAYPSS